MAQIKKFSSIAELSEYLDNGQKHDKYITVHRSEDIGSRAMQWSGTESWEEAQYLLKYGDAANYDAMAAHIGKDITAQTTTISRPVASVCGFFPHVPNFIAGVPTAMVRTEKIRQKYPILNIYYTMVYNWKTDKDIICKNGAKLISTIAELEQKKHIRCNVFIGSVVYFIKETGRWHNYDKYGFFVCVKKSNEAFDLKKLAYPLANPSFLRRHFLRFCEVTACIPFDGGYGSPVTATKNDIPQCDDSDIIINGMAFDIDMRQFEN